jgi:hypothetical protein
MDDITRNLEIIDEFNHLSKRIKETTFRGKKVRIYNLEETVIAAYHLGRLDGINSFYGDLIGKVNKDEI